MKMIITRNEWIGNQYNKTTKLLLLTSWLFINFIRYKTVSKKNILYEKNNDKINRCKSAYSETFN